MGCFRSVRGLALRCVDVRSARLVAVVEVLQALRELEQRYCQGDSAEHEQYKQEFYELRSEYEEDRLCISHSRVQAEERGGQEGGNGCLR